MAKKLILTEEQYQRLLMIEQDEASETKEEQQEEDKIQQEVLAALEKIQIEVKQGDKKPEVAVVQKALTGLGFGATLGFAGGYGIDGIYGPRTAKAVKDFQSKNDISEDGVGDTTLAKLKDSVKSSFDIPKFRTYRPKISFKNDDSIIDNQFYIAVLKGIGVNPAGADDPRVEFMRRWKMMEQGKAVAGNFNEGAANNPLNTTKNLAVDPISQNDWEDLNGEDKLGYWFNTFNAGGREYHVKNYSTPEYGVMATIATLKLPYYTGIVNALKNPKASIKDIISDQGVKSGLKKWSGTGGYDKLSRPSMYTVANIGNYSGMV